MRFTLKLAATAALAALMPLAGAQAEPAKKNWMALVTTGEDGAHTLGNPDAKVELTEFVSYTCPHCGDFQKDAEGPVRLAYVMPGKISVRINNLVRDPVDLTAAMLTNCGDPAGFFKRHHLFMGSHDKWLVKAKTKTEAQQKRWASGDMPGRMRAIASDFGFYAMMEPMGYTRAAVDRCLADKAMYEKLMLQTQTARALGVPGTPSFALNGELLENVHDWKSLDAAIREAL